MHSTNLVPLLGAISGNGPGMEPSSVDRKRPGKKRANDYLTDTIYMLVLTMSFLICILLISYLNLDYLCEVMFK